MSVPGKDRCKKYLGGAGYDYFTFFMVQVYAKSGILKRDTKKFRFL